VRPAKAWGIIDRLPGQIDASVLELDGLRRKLRSRARHFDVYVHPGALDKLLSGGVLGGRDAAAAAGAPIDVEDEHDVYLPASEAPALLNRAEAQSTLEGANVHVHEVDDEAWPFGDGCRIAGPWAAWLDLADRQDRSAEALLDRLLGGRLHA
jgi:hypothetical protein